MSFTQWDGLTKCLLLATSWGTVGSSLDQNHTLKWVEVRSTANLGISLDMYWNWKEVGKAPSTSNSIERWPIAIWCRKFDGTTLVKVNLPVAVWWNRSPVKFEEGVNNISQHHWKLSNLIIESCLTLFLISPAASCNLSIMIKWKIMISNRHERHYLP